MKPSQKPTLHGIALKKQYGQHFLRDQSVIDHMIAALRITPETSVFEIGCGDGFLTRSLLKTPLARLWIFEIDPEWAAYVSSTYADSRLVMHQTNILDVDFTQFAPHAPWVLAANLPYQVTFPIFHLLHKNRQYLQEGVVMVQEEVAQKLVATSGRSFGYVSLFFQHFFTLKLLDKIKPDAFVPPPKVDSRLVYLKPREQVAAITNEEQFWKFIKLCFAHPRRTLKNNLASTHYDYTRIAESVLALRAQQMCMEDFLNVWQALTAA